MSDRRRGSHRGWIGFILLFGVFAFLILFFGGPYPSGEESGATPIPRPSNKIVVNLLEDPYRFEPPELEFLVGKTYTIELIGGSEYHTFTSDELEIDRYVLAGKGVSFTFTAESSGIFSFICIPHESLGMVGTVTIIGPKPTEFVNMID